MNLAEWEGGAIGLAEFQDRLTVHWARRESSITSALGESTIKNAQRRLLNEWIAGEILSLEAATLGVEVSNEEVDARMSAHFPTENQRKATLIKAMVYEKDFREHVRRLILREKLGRLLVEKSPASDEEYQQWKSRLPLEAIPEIPMLEPAGKGAVKAEEERRCAYQILFPEEEEAVACAKRLQHAGKAQFVEEAAQHPNTPLADKGGFMGCFQRGQLPDYLEEVVFRLKPGELSDIIQSSNGFHLILVEDYKKDFEKMEAGREAALRNRWESEIEEQRLADWLADAMKKRKVKINAGLLDGLPPSP